MRKITINTNINRTYKNNGQHLEQCFRYTLTGEIVKADNIAHDKGTDFGNYSIKTARATVCKGTNLAEYLATDRATEFVYITKTATAYIMTKTEYIEFCETFATIDRESDKNGGAKKLRLGKETAKMLEWLAERG